MLQMKSVAAALVLGGLGMSILPEQPRMVREKRPEPTNSAGDPLKRGNHRQRDDKDRDPNKRHRRV